MQDFLKAGRLPFTLPLLHGEATVPACSRAGLLPLPRSIANAVSDPSTLSACSAGFEHHVCPAAPLTEKRRPYTRPFSWWVLHHIPEEAFWLRSERLSRTTLGKRYVNLAAFEDTGYLV